MNSYLFYDIETSGLNKCFDQVLQFAAIRTDEEFNEIDRYEYLLKLNSDTIPHPQALITHRISLSSLKDGLSEFAAISNIYHLINQPGTISLGYNTLGFDDEFLRFCFYRNLLDPYSHQCANHCRRMDVYPMIVMFRLFKPDVIQWPIIDGKLSLKLEHISADNQLSSGMAHDAMVDVEATLALARRLHDQQKMWQYLSEYFIKSRDQQRLESLPMAFSRYRIGLMIGCEFGLKQNYQAPVLLLGIHHHYRNQMLCLRLDLPQLRQARLDDVTTDVWVINKKLAEPGFVLPLTDHYCHGLSELRRTEMTNNLQWLADNQAILQAIDEHYRHYCYPVIANIDASAALYQNGFWSSSDKQVCWQFHHAKIADRQRIIDHIHNRLLRCLAMRSLGRHHYEVMTELQQQSFDDYLQSVWSTAGQQTLPVDFKGQPRYSRTQCLADIAELQQSDQLDQQQQQLLLALKDYMQRPPLLIKGGL